MQDFSNVSCEHPDPGVAENPDSPPNDAPCAHMGLRERKRRLTRLRIEDAATRLFLEHSYGSVTLEEICSVAEISRRTFFNYFDSKDHVALGVAPPPLTEDDINVLANLPPKPAQDDGTLESRLFQLLLARRGDQFEDCDGSALDPDLADEIARRRALILEHNPELALSKLTRFQDLRQKLNDSIAMLLEKHPDQRRFTEDFTVAEEAFLIVSSAISALWTSSALNTQSKHPAIDPSRALTIARALGALHRNIADGVTPE